MLELLALAAVVVAVVLVSAGRTDAMSDEPPDAPDLGLPEDGPLGVHDLERLRFPLALRGYRMADVDRLLDRLAGELERRDEQLRELRPDAVADDVAAEEAGDDAEPGLPPRGGPRRVLRRPTRRPEPADEPADEVVE